MTNKRGILLGLVLCITICMFGCGQSTESKSMVEQYFGKEIHIGEVVTFGAYESDGDTTNGAERIRWNVYNIEGNYLCLVAEECIERISFNVEEDEYTGSAIHKWLTEEFYSLAFTDAEKRMLGGDELVLLPHINQTNQDAKYAKSIQIRDKLTKEYATYWVMDDERNLYATDFWGNVIAEPMQKKNGVRPMIFIDVSLAPNVG